MQYNPRDTDNLKKCSWHLYTELRPVNKHRVILIKSMTRLTLIGGLYITFCMFSSLYYDIGLECSVLFWWNVFVDCCSCNYGFHRTDSKSFNVNQI